MASSKNFNRRDFLKYSAVSGVGLAYPNAVLAALVPMELRFKRLNGTDIFLSTEPATDLQVFLRVAGKPGVDEVLLSSLIDGPWKPGIFISVVFCAVKVDPVKDFMVLSGLNIPKNPLSVLWLNSLGKSDIATALSGAIIKLIGIADTGKDSANSEITVMPDQRGAVKPVFQLSFIGGNRMLVGWDAQKNVLSFKGQNGAKLQVAAHGVKHDVTGFEVPLAYRESTVFKPSSGLLSTPGAICFKAEINSGTPLQVCSPYIFSDPKGNYRHNIEYFESKSMLAGFDFHFTHFPFIPNEGGIVKGDVSAATFLEFEQRKGVMVKTNFIGEKGRNFTVENLAKFYCQLTKASLDNLDSYYFVPRGQLVLSGNKQKQLLLGYSGTERIKLSTRAVKLQGASDFITVDFKLSNKMQFDGDELKERLGSLTSYVTLADSVYYMDADKAPLFNNAGRSLENAQLKVSYAPLSIGKLKVDSSDGLSVIPVLSFFRQKSLQDLGFLNNSLALERVFVKNRLNAAVKLSAVNRNSGAFINPNGFLKKDGDYDFIHFQEKVNSDKDELRTISDGAVATTDLKPKDWIFKVSNTTGNLDFDLSISREDVFFVLTPSMINQLSSALKLQVFFSMSGFDVDLAYDKEISAKNNQLIIFKYSKSSIKDLMEDSSSWSNRGVFKTGLVGLRDKIKAKFKDFKQASLKDPLNYAYVLEQIFQDANWNGVLLLDVPLKGPNSLPSALSGLCASQSFNGEKKGDKLILKTSLGFEYVAFPVNKTFFNPLTKGIDIKSTSFYGLIDYDILKRDKAAVEAFFTQDKTQFVLSKLLTRFENSEIAGFESIAFLKVAELFEDKVNFKSIALSHDDTAGQLVDNLIKLSGSYQSMGDGKREFHFKVVGDVMIKFPNEGILNKLKVTKITFGFTGEHYQFGIDAVVFFRKDFGKLTNLLDFEGLDFQNIGLSFPFAGIDLSLPDISFDLRNLIVLPKIKFSSSGFLNSFPIKFSSFKVFDVFKDLTIPDFAFLDLPVPGFGLKVGGKLWSMIFDFDLGTLGGLGSFKGLVGKLLFGWTKQGGIKLGLMIDGFGGGFHLDLFGALNIDVKNLKLCQLPATGQYIILLDDIHIGVLGMDLLGRESSVTSAMLIAKGGEKLAWLVLNKAVDGGLVNIALGQRINIPDIEQETTVNGVMKKLNGFFEPFPASCKDVPKDSIFNANGGWMIGSENIVPKPLRKAFNLKFVFNDPQIYAAFLEVFEFFKLDIVYKKIADGLGMWSVEFALDSRLRTIDVGAMVITLPNLGISISSRGDWKIDVGFPAGSDWSRSCLLQLRPFVGWCGIYLSRMRTLSLSLFANYMSCLGREEDLQVIQAGMAFRIGIGGYKDGGIYYVGASISVYGILEGAFAFKKEQGLAKLFPDHFALLGRVGAVAELVGYVDFKIVKAAIRIVLQVEIGMLLVYISGKGLQPVPLYIEGRVSVSIDFTITCFKIFGKRICITIHFSFETTVRFEYQLGGDASGCKSKLFAARTVPSQIEVKIGEIPVVPLPLFSLGLKANQPQRYLLIDFMIPFFGLATNGKQLTQLAEENIILERILSPIFTAIETVFNRPLKYKELKNLLIKGRLGESEKEDEILFSFPDYRMLILADYDFEDIQKPEREVLKSRFGLTNAEIDLYEENAKKDCAQKEQCLYRPIPIPPTSRIAFQSPTDSWSADGGFELNLSGVFEGGASKGFVFNRKEEFSRSQIENIGSQFKTYTSQQPDGKKGVSAAALKKCDLREDGLIPDYFRLFALVYLELYVGFLNGEGKEKQADPTIECKSLLKKADPAAIGAPDETKHFNTPRVFEQLIGQVNYYHNSGLRLRDFVNFTAAESRMLVFGQAFQVPELLDEAKLDIAKFDFELSADSSDKHGKTTARKISLRKELFLEKRENEFFNTGRTNHAALLAQANRQFDLNTEESLFPPPYLLRNLQLPLSVDALKVVADPNSMAFYPLKVNFEQDFSGGDCCLFSLFAHDTSAKPALGKDYQAVFSVNFRVKLRRNLDKPYALEISGVDAAELDRMSKIRQYLSDDDFSASLYVLDKAELVPLKVKGMKILKTNVSPVSHPPVILKDRSLRTREEKTETNYLADIEKDKADFKRLVWEGLATNDGGYYLMNPDQADFYSPFDQLIADQKANTQAQQSGVKVQESEFTLFIAFESAVFAHGAEKLVPHFCNYLKLGLIEVASVDENALDVKGQQPVKVINGLFCEIKMDVIDPDSKDSSFVSVKEYNHIIDPDTFHFELCRTMELKPVEINEQLAQYLPLDFSLKRIVNNSSDLEVFNADEVLAIMPQDRITSGEHAATDFVYRHVNPLQKTDLVVNRYEWVGESFKLNFNLRDVYGLRLGKIYKESTFKHRYFDKLIPISAWPLIKISFWIDQAAATEVRWCFRMEVAKDDLIKKGKADERDPLNVKSIASQLENIKHQLADKRCKLKIFNNLTDDEPAFKPIEFDEADKLVITRLLNEVGSLNEEKQVVLGEAFTKCFAFERQSPAATDIQLKTLVAPMLSFFRDAEEDCFVVKPAAVIDRLVWGFNGVREVRTEIPLQMQVSDAVAGEVKEFSELKTYELLDELLENRGFALGIGHLNGKNGLYLIEKSWIGDLAKQLCFDSAKDYYGIKPYANRLWSGSYTGGKAIQQFFNVDLDQALKTVLFKVDEILCGPYMNNSSLLQSMDKLVSLKRQLVKGKATVLDLADDSSELANRLEQVNSDKAIKSKTFENILLKQLSSYYDFEGIVSKTVRGLPQLNGHRLSLGLQPVGGEEALFEKYRLLGAKLHFEKGAATDWTVLFNFLNPDLQVAGENYNFSFNPLLTHIEHSISPLADPMDGIEKSSWIQLVKPLAIVPNGVKVSDLPVTFRSCPPNPVIAKSKLLQAKPDAGGLFFSSKLGEWGYALGLVDPISNYLNKDKMHVKLQLDMPGLRKFKADEQRNFPGFIANWSSKILQGNLELKDAGNTSSIDQINSFVDEMDKQLALPIEKISPLEVNHGSDGDALHFVLSYDETKKWSIDSLPGNIGDFPGVAIQDKDGKVLVTGNEVDPRDMRFTGFNVFKKPYPVAIKPRVWITRNERVLNPNFRYTSEEVSTLNWNTIHLKYYKAIKVKSGKLQEVVSLLYAKDSAEQLRAIFPFKVNTNYLIKSKNLEANRDAALFGLAGEQINVLKDAPSALSLDDDFKDFENGYSSLSIVVSNFDSDADDGLPIFSATTIFVE